VTPGAYCKAHDRWRDGDGVCPVCFDELLAAHPEFAATLLRSRWWRRVDAAVATIAVVLVGLAWVAFAVVREWRIWFR